MQFLRIYLVVEIFLLANAVNWVRLYSEFWNWQIQHCSEGDWTSHNAFGCQYGSQYDKGYNMEMMCPLANVGTQLKSFYIPNPHYQVQLKGDIYYKSNSGSNLGNINVNGVPSMSASTVTQSLPFVYIDCLKMTMQTTTFTHIISHNSDYLNLGLQSSIIWVNNPGSQYQSPTEAVCFRNLDIYMAPCHYSCKSCTGELQNECITCYTGVPSLGICQVCPEFMFLKIPQGCVNSCARLGQAVDQNNVCYTSNTITINSIAFVDLEIATINSEWKLISNSGLDLPLTSIPCENQQFYGSYQYLEKELTFSSQVKKIKIEIILLFKNWITYSQLQIYFNDQLIGIIQKKKYNYEVLLGKQRSFSITSTCLNQLSVEQIGAEYEIPITQISNTIQIKATQDNWSVRDIYIYQIICQANCESCKNDYQCSVCKTSYYNHLGICVTSCPVYSTLIGKSCIDFSEETPNTFYKLKDFVGPQQLVDTSYFILKSTTKYFKKGVDYSNLVYQTVFGGPQNWLFETFQNIFYIPERHYAVRVMVNLMIGDDFRSGSFTIDINGEINFIYTLSSTNYIKYEQLWGLPTYFEKVFFINSYLSHYSDTLTITFRCAGDPAVDQSKAFCAIYNYFIVVLACKPFCNFCTSYDNCLDYIQVDHFNPTTQQCDVGYQKNDVTQTCDKIIYPICGNKIVEDGEMCDDGNDIPFDGCHQCQVMCSPLSPYCEMFFDFTCPIGYKLSLYNKLCNPICGDGLVTQDEECDDGNLNAFDGCFNCKFNCDFGCLHCIQGQCVLCKDGWYFEVGLGICQPICGDNILQPAEACDNNNSCLNCNFICHKNCLVCTYGKCLECQIGFYLNIHNQCISKWGDQFLTQDEQCENTSLYPFSEKCWNSQYQCPENCSICAYNICTQCKQGWILNEQNYCDPICDNKFINQFQCFQKCPDNCSQCTETKCLQCNVGFYLNQLNQECLALCGDKLIVANEECDDGNLISDDGCNNCRLQCDENCKTCVKHIKTGLIQCMQCENGWVMNYQFKCEPICGDGIQTYGEVCDDGIYLGWNQRCLSCEYWCPENCLVCSFGHCLECERGFVYYPSTNSCDSVCGDTFVTMHEECDDYNYLQYDTYDGCYQCKYKCQDSCIACVSGICYLCQQGYLLDSYQKCQAICGDGILVNTEVCESGLYQIDGKCNQCQYSCKEHCQKCVYGICITCEQGYVLQDVSNSCVSYCGDGIIAGLEECDEESFRCQKCQFKYQESCQLGVFGQCFVCMEGWKLNEEESICESVCGDGIITFEESCDDNISSKWKCQNCKKICPNYCEQCAYGLCLQCEYGFTLNTEVNECHSICGDELVVGQEECDDGNLNAFDGCFNCKFHCDFGCLNCINGVCEYCAQQAGWVLESTGMCDTLCGDGIKVQGVEECDNQNTNTNICLDCILQCNPLCNTCKFGQCRSCIEGYWLYEAQNTCIEPAHCQTENGYIEVTEIVDGRVVRVCRTNCGDGIVTSDEECDYGQEPSNICVNCKLKCPNNCQNCLAYGICENCKANYDLKKDSNSCEVNCSRLNQEQCSLTDQNCVQVGDICTIKEYFCEDYNSYNLKDLAKNTTSACGDTLEGYKCILEENGCRSLTCSDLQDDCDSRLLTTVGFQSYQDMCLMIADESMNFKCVERPQSCEQCLSQQCCFDSIMGKCGWNNDQCEITTLYEGSPFSEVRISPYIEFELLILISSIYLLQL